MMTGFRVLHLSDLHFAEKIENDQLIVLDALLSSVSHEAIGPIDLVIFSGDLAFSGAPSEFSKVKSALLDKVLSSTGLSSERLIICPGNHDIDRRVVRRYPYVETGLLSTLQTRDDINSFVDEHWSATPSDLPPPFQRLNEYYKFESGYRSTTCVFSNLFLNVHRLDLGSHQVGVASFNTAWRSTGEANNADRGNLVLGERVVDHALDKMGDCEFRLAVFHHPLSWLTPSDEVATESRLQSQFDVLFCGHIHRPLPSRTSNIHGDAVLSQAGCLYQSRDYFNGFNVIEFDLSTHSITLRMQEYSDQRRTFVSASRVAADGKILFPLLDSRSRHAAVLPTTLRRTKSAIRKLANDHISLDKTGALMDIDRHFVCPPLRALSSSEIDDLPEEAGRETLDKLLADQKSFAIIGRAELGKTTLAHYIAVKTSDGSTDTPRLPLIARFSSLQKGDRVLWRLVREYAAEISEGTIDRAFVESQNIIVIVDDVDLFDQQRIELLQRCIEEHNNAKWALFVRNPVGSLNHQPRLQKLFPDFQVYNLRELHRSAIRALSANSMGFELEEEQTDEMYRRLMQQLQRTGLPRSGYIISLMIWAIKNKSQGEILNEAVLLQNLIDYILGRMDYTSALRREFDFHSKSVVLQSLAFHFKTTAEVQQINEVIAFVIKFLDQKGLKYDASEIVRGFIKCGVLVEIGSAVSFRYRRFQEFFVAGYLHDNPRALAQVKDRGQWFEFMRELDLYTARFRHESSFLDYAEAVLETFDDLPGMSATELNRYLSDGHSSDFSLAQLKKMRDEPMTAQKIDALMDKTERRISEKRESETEAAIKNDTLSRSDARLQFSAAVEMYSEFIRNLEFADRDVKRRHLSNCIGYWERMLQFSFAALKEAIADVRDDLNGQTKFETKLTNSSKKWQPVTQADWKNLVDLAESLMKYALPSFLSEIAYHNLGSEKLIDFIDEVITDEAQSEVRKLFCTFILLELSPERAIDRLSVIISGDQMDRWFLSIATQRLYAYYSTRPLSSAVKKKFEMLAATIELKLAGKAMKGGSKGMLMSQIKKKAYSQNNKLPKS